MTSTGIIGVVIQFFFYPMETRMGSCGLFSLGDSKTSIYKNNSTPKSEKFNATSLIKMQ